VFLSEYYYGDQVKERPVKGSYGSNWSEDKCTQSLIESLKEKKLLGRPRSRPEDIIKMYLQET
jgi:hypothetical protein